MDANIVFRPVRHKSLYVENLHFKWEFLQTVHACLLLYEDMHKIATN